MPSKNSFEKFRQTCLLGRLDKALWMIKRKQIGEVTRKRKSTVRAIQKRFSEDYIAEELDPKTIQGLIQFYERYWHRSLLDIQKHKVFEKELRQSIREWLLLNYKVKATSKNCFKKLESCLNRRGIKCLVGKVSHLQDFQIWKKESARNFDVSLLESNQRVKVVFMKDYLTYGWMDYATCGASKVGGWAKEKALFCNAAEYDVGSEDFKVSYLTHEAQHFSDYKKFKKLDSYALEYRAKLAEIISSRRSTRKLVDRFKSQSSKSRHSYHHYAAYKLISNLGRAIEGTPAEIRKRASRLLMEDSQHRRRTGFKSL